LLANIGPVIKRDKHSSLLWYETNYSRKKFCGTNLRRLLSSLMLQQNMTLESF